MFERLTDGELVGSPVSATDLPQLLLVLTNPEIGRTLGGARSHEQVLQIFVHWREVWAKHGFGPFLFRAADGALIGYSGLMPAPSPGLNLEPTGKPIDVELLYASLPETWGRGLVTRMSRLVVDWAFRNLDIQSLVAYTLTTNHASMGVMNKLGFVYEADVEKAALPHVLYRLPRACWQAGESN